MGIDRTIIARLAVLLIAALAVGAEPPRDTPAPAPAPRREVVRIGDQTFRLEVALDDASRDRGLGGRERIALDGGMLFVFPTARPRRFWMVDCAIDIDIVFLDALGRIVAGHRMKAERPRGADESEASYHRRLRLYPSRRSAQFAIELAAGSLDRLSLRRGDHIDLDRVRLVAEARAAARPPRQARPRPSDP